jgi:alpha-beta hydrolase superfamily lysophospholipase
MQIELVQATTADEIVLDGAFLPPPAEVPASQAIDSLLLVHGSGGSFYRGNSLSRASMLRDAGFAVGVINTRGHDVVAIQNQERFMGNAFEILDDTRYDLDAAIGLMAERGYSRIGLVGLSLGSPKIVHYQAETQDPRVAGLVTFGPVRLSHSYFLASEDAEEHKRIYERAKELVESGQPDTLMPVDFPNAHAMFTAAVYLDRHCTERYNMIPMMEKIHCPLLILAGTGETATRHLDCAQDMFDASTANPSVELKLVEDATHMFPGMDDEFIDPVVQWARSLQPVQTPA